MLQKDLCVNFEDSYNGQFIAPFSQFCKLIFYQVILLQINQNLFSNLYSRILNLRSKFYILNCNISLEK